MIVKNEEKVLFRCLESLNRFAEIVIYFNDTTDTSPQIAQQFSNVKSCYGEFIDFGTTRNKASQLVSNDWCFVIDADEQCSAELVSKISTIDFESTNPATVFSVKKKILNSRGGG